MAQLAVSHPLHVGEQHEVVRRWGREVMCSWMTIRQLRRLLIPAVRM